MIEKKDTIAATMAAFMATGPSVEIYPTYKALNDAVGAVHDKDEGKVQALAGEKAWQWTPDTETKMWRHATPEEVAIRREAAATKNRGTRKSKVLSPEDRAALDAQIAALKAVDNPALAPLLADLQGKQAADDAARKGTLKTRLATAVEKTGLELAVKVLEKLIARAEAEMAAEEATEDVGE